MAPGAKVLGQGSIRGQKTLRRPGGFASLPTRRALACGPRRVLTAGMELTTLTGFHAGQALALRRAVARELVRDAHPWHVLQPLEPLAPTLLRRLGVAPPLPQDVEDVGGLIDGAP
jgi:hypothetical protein